MVDETTGFRDFAARDLLGFVDGTANPAGAELPGATLIGADADPDFAGGSYVVVQKYLHDMAGWAALSTERQRRSWGGRSSPSRLRAPAAGDGSLGIGSLRDTA